MHDVNLPSRTPELKSSKYLALILAIISIGFILDLITSKLVIEIGPKSILDSNGKIITTLEAVFPIWHQILKLTTNFLYALAATIFITIFIANKLQEAQQSKQEEELRALHNAININVFDSLFKTIIPEKIFKIIKQDIIENKVLRKDAKWLFEFSEVDGKIICRQTTRYEPHNLSQQEVNDPITLDLDSLGGDKYSIISAECLSSSGEILVHFDPHNNNKRNIEVQENGQHTKVSYTIKIPPESYVEYKTVFERTYDGSVIDTQGTKVPVVGADIIAFFPEEYEFGISAMMSSKPRLITDSKTQKIFKVDGGILPYQGILFYLRKIG